MGFWPPMIGSLMAAVVTTVGIYVMNRFAKWAKRNILYFISFAAAVLISVSFMHIIPTSFGMNRFAPVYLLVGFLALHIVNRFMDVFVCSEKYDYKFGVIPALGIGFHSFMDGMIYSVTFSVSMLTGVLAAVGMVCHEFPEGIVTFVLLAKSGFSKGRASWYAFLAAAISTPLGMLVSYPFVSRLSPGVLGALLALSAGALVYVGATHLLPKVEEESKWYTLLSLAGGILVAVVIILTKH